jgi:hypothetical protein
MAVPVLAVEWANVAPESAPSPGARALLAEWAEARGVHLVSPGGDAPPHIAIDPKVADAVEDALLRARDAITADDAPHADEALAKAEALLEAHPELPQAPWLLAEVLRTKAARLRQLPPHDARRAAEAWAGALSLDGGRAAGLGEHGTEMGASVSPQAGALVLEGAFDGLTITLDGLPSSPSLHAPAGQHQILVRRSGALVWAGWVSVGGTRAATLSLPEPPSCSRQDLGKARVEGARVRATGVRCGAWVSVEDVGVAGLLVATCGADSCGPRLAWTVGSFGPIVPDRSASAHHVPRWVPWAAAAAGVVAVTAITLAATGAFRPTHDEPIWTTGGIQHE